MINWIYRRILNRHRLLFRYWNGSRFVSEDPFTLLRALVSSSKIDLDSDLQLLDVPDIKVVTRKVGQLAEEIREIFQLKPLSNGGLSELECVNLLIQFINYLERVKKNGDARLTSDTSSDSATENEASGSADLNAMKELSGSTLTTSES